MIIIAPFKGLDGCFDLWHDPRIALKGRNSCPMIIMIIIAPFQGLDGCFDSWHDPRIALKGRNNYRRASPYVFVRVRPMCSFVFALCVRLCSSYVFVCVRPMCSF